MFPEIHFIYTLEDLERLQEYIQENEFSVFTLDVETDSSNERKAQLYGIGLCFEEDTAFYIPIKDNRDIDYWRDLAPVKDLIQVCAENIKMVGHNILYDILVIKNNWGMDLRDNIYSDTMLQKHTLDEERPFGLKDVAVKYLGDWADIAQKELYENIKANGGRCTKEHMEMYLADTEVLGKYCAWDVFLTLKLFNMFEPRLKEEKLDKFFYEEEVMPLYKEVTIGMKDKGFPINVAHFEKLKEEISQDIAKLSDAIYDTIKDIVAEYELSVLKEELTITSRSAAGKLLVAQELATVENKELVFEWSPAVVAAMKQFYLTKNEATTIFNLNSTHHLSWLFFKKLELEPIAFTDGGAPKLDAATLEEFSGSNPIADKIIDFKKLQKLKSTYIEGLLDIQHEGVVYSSFLQHGTTSGRYSSTAPNCQNLPRVKDEDSGLTPLVLKYSNAIREGFISNPGYSIVAADQGSLEPRAFAEASGDVKLQEVFKRNLDLYSAIAIESFGLSDASADPNAKNYLKKLHPEARQKSKIFCLAVVYGSGAPRIAQLLGIDKEEAQRIIDSYLNAYPDLKLYIESCHSLATNYGKIVSKFGRVRHLPLAKQLHTRYGEKLLDWKWAKKNNKGEERYQMKNLLNNSTNFPIQSCAASIMNRAMIEIAKRFKKEKVDGYICSMVHDEVVCIVHDSQIELAGSIIQDCMENTCRLEVPLTAEPAIAKTWDKAK